MYKDTPDDQTHPNAALATESDHSPPRGSPFPIVGIGASAGGLEAFSELLSALPAHTGMAFVLVQHLDPQHDSMLTEILAPATKMPTEQVHDGMEVKPDHVYIIPPNASMALRDGHLWLVAREPGLHLPVDIFFRSLAQAQGSKAIGVVLSGNASDGSIGVQAIKAECGITFAQDEESARFGGMPRNAMATGAVDYALPPAEIGRELGRLGQHRFMVPAQPGEPSSEVLPEGDGDLKRILSILHTATKVDFSQYKPTTIQRRIGRRMMILKVENLAEYARYLQKNTVELRELYKDVLISVTRFFRDEGSFEALTRLFAENLEQRKPGNTIRAWVPGCASGEEVYSLAICLQELLQNAGSASQIQLFGTDISDIALDRARRGMYGAEVNEDVSDERLKRFFTKLDHGYVINKSIRELCVFARHDLTNDPPFSHLDLISCRNVLIYLDGKAHRRVLATFHYALKPTGRLMLGSAETTGVAHDLFKPLDREHHIFVPKPLPNRLVLDLSASGRHREPAFSGVQGDAADESDLQKKLDQVIQSKYSPIAVLVNSDFQILQFRGNTTAFLNLGPTVGRLNVLRVARENLVLPLRRCLENAVESGAAVKEGGIHLETVANEILIEVTPLPVRESEERLFLIVFMPDGQRGSLDLGSDPVTAALPVNEQVDILQRELSETREYLRNISEEYEGHAEELRALNEESRSANEELQSTNEELGTTKEELQSANEELTTVNEELQSRNSEIAATNSDLRNLLTSVSVAILMIDQDLRIHRFNSAAERLLDLRAVDIGRPVGHVRGRINTSRLEQKAQMVIDSLHATTEDLQDGEGHWFSVGIRPYRTVDDRIAGAVVTFQDIDPLKRGLDAEKEAREYAEAMIETVREPLVVLDGDFRVQQATAEFYKTFLVSREETVGRFLYDLGNGQWNVPRLRELLGAALFRSEAFQDFEIEFNFPHIGRRTMRLNARRIPRNDAGQRMLLLAIEDVTDRRHIAEIRFQRLFETAKDGIVVVDLDTETVQDVNAFFLQLTGFRREELVGKTMTEAGKLMGLPKAAEILPATRKNEIVRRGDVELSTRTGNKVTVEVVANRYMVGTQPVVQLKIRDISARKQTMRALEESEARFRLFVESVRDYAMFQLDANGKVVTWNTGAERLLGWKEAEVLGRGAALIFTPEDIERGAPAKEMETARLQGRAEDERWHRRKDGSCFFASGVMTAVRDEHDVLVGFAKVMRDQTARMEQDQQLRRSLEEKTMLVREIHHRVKNNLQVIVSLLSLQSEYTTDSDLLSALEETQGRVRAIARIHEQLYASDDLSEVEVGAYVTSLARELITLHAIAPEEVGLAIQVQPIVMHVEQAVPVGLIANELIVNSLKHGLNNGTVNLKISLDYMDAGFRTAASPPWVQLRVQDDGPGLPLGLDSSKTRSMGFRLINLLVRQLAARLEIGKGPGADIAVSFPLKAKIGPLEAN